MEEVAMVKMTNNSYFVHFVLNFLKKVAGVRFYFNQHVLFFLSLNLKIISNKTYFNKFKCNNTDTLHEKKEIVRRA